MISTFADAHEPAPPGKTTNVLAAKKPTGHSFKALI